jgi:DNA gyrase subunit A
MRLQKLTSLETQKIVDELLQLQALIAHLKDLLASPIKILALVRKELQDVSEMYGDPRRTEIVSSEIEQINIEDLIQREEMVVILTNRGYIKRVPYSAYRVQTRGGKGASSSNLKDDDYIKNLFIASTHDVVLFLTSEGRAYWMKVHEIPEGSRTTKGQHVRGILPINPTEEISTIVALQNFTDDKFLFICTAKGVVKKVSIGDFSNAKLRGIYAITLREDDKVMGSMLTDGENDILMVTRSGKGLRFSEKEVRAMGRTAQGVGGISLVGTDEVAGLVETKSEDIVILVTENGHGKRMRMDDLMPHHRYGQGQRVYRVNEKTGEVVGVVSVRPGDNIIAITSKANAVNFSADTVPIYNPDSQGVRVVSIEKPDYVVAIDRPAAEDGPIDLVEGSEPPDAIDFGAADTPEV